MNKQKQKNKKIIIQNQWVFDNPFNLEFRTFSNNHILGNKIFSFSSNSTEIPIVFSSVSIKSNEYEKKLNNLSKIKSFSQFKMDWNGYGAKPISKTIINKANKCIEKFEKQPKVFPTSRSTVQFEWDSLNNKYLEIELFSNFFYILKIYNHKEIEYKTYSFKKCMEEINEYFR